MRCLVVCPHATAAERSSTWYFIDAHAEVAAEAGICPAVVMRSLPDHAALLQVDAHRRSAVRRREFNKEATGCSAGGDGEPQDRASLRWCQLCQHDAGCALLRDSTGVRREVPTLRSLADQGRGAQWAANRRLVGGWRIDSDAQPAVVADPRAGLVGQPISYKVLRSWMVPAIGIASSRLRCEVGVAKGSSDEWQSVTIGEAHCGVCALLNGHEVGLAGHAIL